MISYLLSDIEPFWFNSDSKKNLWFQSNPIIRGNNDIYIREKYGQLLLHLENTKIPLLTWNNDNYYTTIDLVNIIICLDQFSRHIYRDNPCLGKKIKANTFKAARITNYLIQTKKIYMCSSQQIAFILMPLKHLDIYQYFPIIDNLVNRVYQHDFNMVTNNSNDTLIKFYIDSLTKYSLSDAHSPRSNIYREDVYPMETLEAVCDNFPLLINNIELNPNTYLSKICLSFCKKISKEIDTIIISLSGGVDSMVLTYILSKLKWCHHKDIMAFHLNYNNRKESHIEQQVIARFCHQLGIKLYIYEIPYIRRDNMPREFYEKITREIRFKMYRLLGGNIVLGHIKDDLIENIWTNFAKGRDLFKLHKIDTISQIDGVNILRPFSHTEKKDILSCAYQYDIPFLKNTTPNWSNRGKMRTEFLPAVERQFGKEASNKIMYLSSSLESYKKILDKMVFQPLFQSVVYTDYGLKVYIGEFVDMDLHFWQEVLTYLFHSLGYSMPSIKSIKNFVGRLKKGTLGKIELKKECIVTVNQELELTILQRYSLNEITSKG